MIIIIIIIMVIMIISFIVTMILWNMCDELRSHASMGPSVPTAQCTKGGAQNTPRPPDIPKTRVDVTKRGLPVEHVWNVCGTCMDHVWNICGTCRQNAGHFS